MQQVDRQHPEGTFATADGLTIFHRAWLPAAEAKAVVLLFHGLGEHSGRYHYLGDALAAQGYAVHAPDHRGHGRSEGKRTFVKSYDEYMRDLVQFRLLVEAQHPGLPVVVLGHSMGGNLAIGHVLDHPDGVRGLAVSGAALDTVDNVSPVQMKIFSVLAKIAPGVRPQGLSAAEVSRDPAVVAAYENDPLVFHGKISAGLGVALLASMERFRSRYAELRLPLLIMHGTDDRIIPVASSHALEAAAVNADVTAHYYEGLFHEVFNEPERDQVIGDLVAWLDRAIA